MPTPSLYGDLGHVGTGLTQAAGCDIMNIEKSGSSAV